MRPGRNRRSFAGAGAFVWVLLGLFGLARCASAQATMLEFEVKAAFILNFTKFVTWPADAFPASDSPIMICILGRDPFGRVMDETLQGENVNARKLIVRRVSEAETNGCHVVFFDLPATETRRILSGLGSGVLTVGDGGDFLRDGGVIAFVIENHRVRFDINQSAADRAGLRLSSKLLSVARNVEK